MTTLPCVDDGGPAFPHDRVHHNTQVGMSLRDYFAAQALPSVIVATSAGQHTPRGVDGDGANLRELMARDAYELADAMLKARSPT